MLNGNDQDEGDGDGAEHEHDDEKDRRDGKPAGDNIVFVEYRPQILRHGGLARQVKAGIIFRDDGADFVQLLRDLRGGGAEIRSQHDELHSVLVEDAPDLFRKEEIRDAVSDDLVIGDHALDAGHRLQPCLELSHGPVVDAAVHDHDVLGGDIEKLLHLPLADQRRQVLRQGLGDPVIDICMLVRIVGGDQHDDEDQDPEPPVLKDPPVEVRKVRKQAPVLPFFDVLVKDQDEAGEHQDHAQDAHHDALCHDKAQVQAQGELHGAEGQEAGNRSERASGQGAEGRCHGFRHGVPDILVLHLLLFIAPVEEDGIVHGHRQLQNSRDRLGDIGDLPEDDVGAHVIDYGEADAGEEQEGDDRRFKGQEQDDEGQDNGDHRIDRQLREHQLLNVLDHAGHAGGKAPFVHQAADPDDRLHAFLGGQGFVQLDDHHGRAVLVEIVPDGSRQEIRRDLDADEVGDPDRIAYVVNFFDVPEQSVGVGGRHVFDDDHRGGRRLERILQQLFPCHGGDILRKIGENVIVDLRPDVAEDRRNQEEQSDGKDEAGPSCEPVGELSDHSAPPGRRSVILMTRLLFPSCR